MKAFAARLLTSDKVRFLLAGASTMAFSYLVYWGLLQVLQPKPAYGLAYVAGIGWSYVVTTAWVFRRAPTWRGLASFPLVYLVQAAVSFGVFVLLIDIGGLHPLLAPLVTVIAALPLTYVLGRAVVNRTSPPSPSP